MRWAKYRCWNGADDYDHITDVDEALKPCWTRHSFDGQDMSLAWTTADSQNNCSMLSSQLVNGTNLKAGRGSGTKDRPAWRAATRKGTKHFERSRLQSLDDKRSARKNRVPNPSTAVPCQLGGKICASTFGLQAHMCKDQHWRVIFVFEGLLLLQMLMFDFIRVNLGKVIFSHSKCTYA